MCNLRPPLTGRVFKPFDFLRRITRGFEQRLLERTFGEHKSRTKILPHFFTEEAAMKLSFAVLLSVAEKWLGVRMDVLTTRQVEELRKSSFRNSRRRTQLLNRTRGTRRRFHTNIRT